MAGVGAADGSGTSGLFQSGKGWGSYPRESSPWTPSGGLLITCSGSWCLSWPHTAMLPTACGLIITDQILLLFFF